MAVKKITEEPRNTDTISFDLTCPGADGCFTSNPYRVDRVAIYYVERDFKGNNFGEYEKQIIPAELESELIAAEKAVCESPTAANLLEVDRIKSEIVSSAQNTTLQYRDRVPVKIYGSEGEPAWLSIDADNSELVLEEEDEDGNTQYGRFTLEWSPKGSVREGHFFICWTWSPLIASDKLSAHLPFVISGDPQSVVSIPTHMTPERKYETLLERYLPDMYKQTLRDDDITPATLDTFNQSIASGFTLIENMANQIIDLFDANALHESLLVYLSNLFNLKLKSSDPTLWRRQIKEAVPLFKKKGTLRGLQEAFAQSGMTLDQFTQFWQIVSPYTWVESFKVTNSPTFQLEKNTIITPINEDNFGLWLMKADEDEYEELNKDYVIFETGECGTILNMTWVGDELSANARVLEEDDRIKIIYQYNTITSDSEQQLEDYIRELPLADQRDESDQDYPPKNWNVRLITEEDPLFDVLVPSKHPFHDPLTFGYIRTEFAYSENIYNMEEYNGSTRPSNDPCFIDKAFRDPCGACISSKYTVDVSVEELCNDRISEAQDILKEYTPFHAVLHSLNFAGEVVEFVQPPEETIQMLVTVDYTQNVISGNSNPIFHRAMAGGSRDYIVDREDLADKLTVLEDLAGTGYNEHVAFISPDVSLKSLGIIQGNHILEILAPSGNEGTYEMDQIDGSTARIITTVNEPIDETTFTFNLSNILYGNNVSNIEQDDLVKLSDTEVDFAELGVKTLWDIENTADYDGGAWKVLISAYSATPYDIVDIVDGVLILQWDSTLPTSDVTDVTYVLKDDTGETIETNDEGVLSVTRRGYVDLNDAYLADTKEILKMDDYLIYDDENYRIMEFDDNNFWIEGYEEGDATGVTIQVRRRLLVEEVGCFGYRGLRLITASNHETGLEIVNGENPVSEDLMPDDNHFKENYLFKIGDDYFRIVSIDGDQVVLSGRDQAWTTAAEGGTALTYSVVHFPKKEVDIELTIFDHLDRDGQDPVIREIETTIDEETAIVALSMPSGTTMKENVAQEEGISFSIITSSGETIEGEL